MAIEEAEDVFANLDNIRINTYLPADTPLPKTPPKRFRKGREFVKGPIPIDWLDASAELPKSAFRTGYRLWRWAGIQKTHTDIKFSATSQGINRSSMRRGIEHLEKAGLIYVRRTPGKALRITILDVPSSANEKNSTNSEKD
jgi:hypothetical protein